MLIISGTTRFQIEEPTAVVLGKFDGVHIGHQHLIKKLLAQKEQGLKTVVFTFDKSPASLFIQDGSTYRELCTPEEKRTIFEQMGVDILMEFPMNAETAMISPEAFITDILQGQLNCRYLAAGEDVTFGYLGLGDRHLLAQYSDKCGYTLEILEKLLVSSVFSEETAYEEIGSTGIRREISAGNMERAARLMGRRFCVTGKVVFGLQLAGTALNMPTANVRWPENKVFPAFGVYFTKAYVDGAEYEAVTNVGRKPTVTEEEEGEVLAETYLYDFTGDLYGREITLVFYAFHRAEERFDSLELLKEQLRKDGLAGRDFWRLSNRKKLSAQVFAYPGDIL